MCWWTWINRLQIVKMHSRETVLLDYITRKNTEWTFLNPKHNCCLSVCLFIAYCTLKLCSLIILQWESLYCTSAKKKNKQVQGHFNTSLIFIRIFVIKLFFIDYSKYFWILCIISVKHQWTFHSFAEKVVHPGTRHIRFWTHWIFYSKNIVL